MRTGLALILASLALLPAADAGGASADPGSDNRSAAAGKKLETARANLAAAVQRIEKDPPSNADLDAAHAAVGELKAAIDAGAEYEQSDLDYAKAALAARRELRTQREFVDQRRAKVHIFDQRRAIEGALATLGDRVKRLEGKDASPKDYDDARAAADELKKLVDDSKEFTQHDQTYASYVVGVDATLARQLKAIDERSTARLVDLQRAALDEGRRGLSTAMAALGAGAGDALFEAADHAAVDLSKRLEDGKALEAKDKAYHAETEKIRAELAQAKKKMDEIFSATSVERLKSEIEPSRKDLAAAAKALRGKSPTADELAEAKTAAFVVHKLVDKYQAQASHSPAFGQYLGDVKKTLVEVETELQRRSLEAARAPLAQALRPIDLASPIPTDAQFSEANTALSALEKALEALGTPQPAMVQPVADARALLTASRATLAKRRVEVGLEPARLAVAMALKPLALRTPTEAQFADVDTALSALEKALEAIQKVPEAPRIAKAIADAQAQLGTGRTTAARRRAEVAIDSARTALTAALRPLEQRAVSDAQFTAADAALTSLDKTLGSIKSEDEAVVKAVADARAQLDTSRATVAKRRVEVSLDSARTAVAQAMAPLDKRVPADEQFTQALNALGGLEKAISAVQNPDAAAALADAKAALKDARARWVRRRSEVSLESARAGVAQSLKPIDLASPVPTDEQFSEANTAVTVLEKTLEGLGTQDPALAQLVADARALLGTARATLAKRRVEVGLDPARLAVAMALKPLALRTPTDAQFAELDTALSALEKALEAVQKVPEAPRIAKSIADAQSQLGAGRTTVARRRAEVAIDSARTALTAALKPLELRAVSDAQFAAADAALAALEKTLGSVKSEDEAVVKAVADARAQLDTSRATVAKRRVEVSLDSARTAVVQAMAPLDKRAPTDEQFAEAKTALAVLEKTIEGAKNPDAAAALTEAKAALKDARTKWARRRAEVSLESARAGVTQSERPLAAQSPTDEQFAEANTALSVLEKTLAAVPPDDAPIAVADAKAALRDAQAAVAKRRLEVDLQRQRAKVEDARKTLAGIMAQIQDASAAKVQEADAASKQLQDVLEAGAALIKKDREYAVYDVEVRKRIAEMNGQIAKRKIALAAGDGKTVLGAAVGDAKAKLKVARQPESTDAEIAAAAKSVDVVTQALETRVSIEEQDRGYAAAAAKARDELGDLREDLDVAKHVRALRRVTVEALAESAAAAKSAAAEPDIRKQKALYEKALTALKACQREGPKMVEQKSALATAVLILDGGTLAPKDAFALCAQKQATTEQALEKVEALIRFDEEPKRAFELAKDLLAHSKKSEALAQFRACISSGRYLEHFNPDWKDRKFEVAGAKMTIAELIAACTKERDTLDPK